MFLFLLKQSAGDICPPLINDVETLKHCITVDVMLTCHNLPYLLEPQTGTIRGEPRVKKHVGYLRTDFP